MVRLSDGKGEDTGKVRLRVRRTRIRPGAEKPAPRRVSRDGQLIVIGYRNGYIRLWNRQGKTFRKPRRKADTHERRVTCLAVVRMEQTIVSGGEEGHSAGLGREANPIESSLTGHDGSIALLP
jgi:WD40 repeat protein